MQMCVCMTGFVFVGMGYLDCSAAAFLPGLGIMPMSQSTSFQNCWNRKMCGKGNCCDCQKNCQVNQPARALLFEHLAHDLPAQPFLDAVKFQAECAEKGQNLCQPDAYRLGVLGMAQNIQELCHQERQRDRDHKVRNAAVRGGNQEIIVFVVGDVCQIKSCHKGNGDKAPCAFGKGGLFLLCQPAQQNACQKDRDAVCETIEVATHGFPDKQGKDQPDLQGAEKKEYRFFRFGEKLVVPREEQVQRQNRRNKPEKAVDAFGVKVNAGDIFPKLDDGPFLQGASDDRHDQKRQQNALDAAIIEGEDIALADGKGQTDAGEQEKDIHAAKADTLEISLNVYAYLVVDEQSHPLVEK